MTESGWMKMIGRRIFVRIENRMWQDYYRWSAPDFSWGHKICQKGNETHFQGHNGDELTSWTRTDAGHYKGTRTRQIKFLIPPTHAFPYIYIETERNWLSYWHGRLSDMKVRHVLDGKGITGPLLETRKQRKFLRVWQVFGRIFVSN